MRFYTCDKTGEKLTENEVTVLKLTGPMDLMVGRKELHLSKDASRELARWFGFPVADPVPPFSEADALEARSRGFDVRAEDALPKGKGRTTRRK